MNKNKKWSMNVALVYLSIHLNTSSNDNTSLSWLSSEELINKQTEEPSCSNLLSKLRLMTCMFGLYCQMVMTTMYQPFITFSGFFKTIFLLIFEVMRFYVLLICLINFCFCIFLLHWFFIYLVYHAKFIAWKLTML